MTATQRPLDMDSEPTKGAGLERILAVWSRRKWLAIPVFALPFAIAISAILALPNLYRSTATVLVERQQVPESFVRSTVTSELETRLQTISQEVLSRGRLETLITQLGLYTDQRKQALTSEIVEQMRRDIQLDIKAVTGRQAATVAFSLSYRGRDPETVALVANTLASSYVDENLKARERQASGTTKFLKQEIAETKKRLDEQERRVSEFKRRYVGELPQQMQANLATLEVLNTQLRLNSDNQVRAVERRQALLAQLAEADSFPQGLAAPGGPATGPEPPALHLARLKQELTAARTRYTDAHPTVTRLTEEIAAVERDLGATKSAAKAAAPPATVAPASPYVLRLRESLHTAESELKILSAEDQRLRSAVAGYQSRVENTPKREQEFQDVSRDYDSTREAHQSLAKRYEEAQLAESMEQRQKGEQFRILDPALPSTVTAAPNRLRLLAMALALSLGLGAGVAILAEILDTSFHSAAELGAFTPFPVLVSIARIFTDADLRQRRLRFRLIGALGLAGVALVAGAAYFVAHGNEQLVRMLGA
jgi:polysaccharide chain length determinant protein (PEP-CTERM system associated)